MRAPQLGVFLTALFLSACGGTAPEPAAPSEFDGFSDSGDADTSAADGSSEGGAPSPEPLDGADGVNESPPTTDSASEPLGQNSPSRKPPGNTVPETRTTKVISDVVIKNRQSVRDCYEKELAKSPGLRGTITIHFKLDSKGRVSFAEVSSKRTTLTQPTLGKCAIEAIKKIQFPKSSRGFESEVNYPFDFKP